MKSEKKTPLLITLGIILGLSGLSFLIVNRLNKIDHIKESTFVLEKINAELRNKIFDRLPKILKRIAEEEIIVGILNQKSGFSEKEISSILKLEERDLDALAVYLMNKDGRVVASSLKILKNKNYAFRPYFKEIMENNKKEYIYLALGIKTNKRGVYFSTPVYSNKEKKGVLVIKIGLKCIDEILEQTDEIINLITPEGIIFATNKKEFKYKSMEKISSKKLNQIYESKQFSNKKIEVVDLKKNKNRVELKNKIANWNLVMYVNVKNLKFKAKEISLYIYILIMINVFSLIIYFLMKNIFERKKLEKELKKFLLVVDQSPNGTTITDADGIVEYVNEEYLKIYECRKTDIINKKINLNGKEEIIYQTLNENRIWRTERKSETKKGNEFWEEFIIAVLLNEKREIINYITVHKEINDRKKAQVSLELQASIDGMTGVFNRKSGLMYLEKQIELAKRNKNKLTIIFADINDLKRTNDFWGHNQGDKLILYATKVFKKLMRASDTIARLGGDEFLLIFNNCGEEEALDIQKRAEKEAEKINDRNNEKFELSVSYGIAEYKKEKHQNTEELIAEADSRMYQNKKKYKEEKEKKNDI